MKNEKVSGQVIYLGSLILYKPLGLSCGHPLGKLLKPFITFLIEAFLLWKNRPRDSILQEICILN
jgi:hypothetical protein